MQDMQVWFLVQEDSLEKETAIHSSVLAQEITEEKEIDTQQELKKWFMCPTLHTYLIGKTLACQ